LPASSETILWVVRLPRVLLAAAVGGGLAVVGATLQSVFRNPLADSGLLGVGAGAALGAVAAVRLGWGGTTFFALPVAAFAGAMAAVLVLYALSRALGGGTLHGLLLTGISVSALAAAGTSMLLVATEEFRVKTVLFWLAGGLEGRSWTHVQLAALFILAGVALLALLSRPLDVLSLGQDEAASLGLAVHATRLTVFALSALVAGAATAVAGAVPFVGLMAPHALRPRVGLTLFPPPLLHSPRPRRAASSTVPRRRRRRTRIVDSGPAGPLALCGLHRKAARRSSRHSSRTEDRRHA